MCFDDSIFLRYIIDHFRSFGLVETKINIYETFERKSLFFIYWSSVDILIRTRFTNKKMYTFIQLEKMEEKAINQPTKYVFYCLSF